jgi:hypothetical protein
VWPTVMLSNEQTNQQSTDERQRIGMTKTKTNQPTTSPLTPPAPLKKRAVVRKRKSDDFLGVENDVDAPMWQYTAFSEVGAITLAKTMKKLGCSIIEKPKQRKDGLWIFSFTNPLLEIDRLRTVVK